MKGDTKMQIIMRALGRIKCMWKGRHVEGHKTRTSRLTPYEFPFIYGYQCKRCGHVREAPMPKPRKPKVEL